MNNIAVNTGAHFELAFLFSLRKIPRNGIAGSYVSLGLPWRLSSEETACSAGDLGLISGLGRPPGEGNVYLLQCSCLGNGVDEESDRAIVHGITKSWTRVSY